MWMRTAGLPDFRKLIGKIDNDLKAGNYSIKIDNQYNVAPFGGTKSFVMSTTNSLGGKNTFLAVSYIVVGTLCVIFAIIFSIASSQLNKN